MLLPRSQQPLRAALSSIGRSASVGNSQVCLNEAFGLLSIKAASPVLTFVRHATHAQQGAVNKAKDGPGKRLGAKKSGEQYVIPGNIIFRQRGTHWFPGDHCAMGRDHTIYATQTGYVKYYKDPEKHPKRQYIGVVFERHQSLPLPRNSPRRRRLGMVAMKMETAPIEVPEVTAEELGGSTEELAENPVSKSEQTGLKLKDGYMYRESNWEIGRAAEKANITVRKFVPGDRWTAWKKKIIRKAKAAEKRRLGGGKKQKQKQRMRR